MSCAALPLLRFCRHTLVWAAVLLLSCCPVGRLKAGAVAEPAPPAGAAKTDPFRSEELTIPAGEHRLAGTLYLPRSGPPAPAVVFVHGAGPAVRGDGYHELARHFARKGVAALIYDLIKDLARRDKAILLVDQNIKRALEIADYVYVMRTGTIVTEGSREAFGGDTEALVARWLYASGNV